LSRYVWNLCNLTPRNVSRYDREFETGLCLLPELECAWNGIDIQLLPPRRFVTRTMQLAVVKPANRDDKLIAYCASKGARLRKPEVMRV